MKKKQFMSKLAALAMATAMGVTALPVTAMNVMAATAESAAPSPSEDAKKAAKAMQDVLKDITIVNDAEGSGVPTKISSSDTDTLSKLGLDKVQDAIKTLDATEAAPVSPATVSFTPTYTASSNTLKVVATVASATNIAFNGTYNLTYVATVESETAVENALKALDL